MIASLLLSLSLQAAAAAPPAAARPADRILAIHNRERARIGVPPLAWSARLAGDASAYAATLARLGRLRHSPPAARPGAGENLAMGTHGHHDVATLTGLWAAEKRLFENGLFPRVSRNGDWRSVGHYTAMIWRDTTSVGCGAARGGGELYLVCRYAPAGNVIGRRVH